MAFDFPSSPANGQEFTPSGGPTYVYNGYAWDPRPLPAGTTIANAGHILPAVTATYDVGSATLRWRTVYTSDLSLKNGIGDWTIVEGADDLFIRNNLTGRTYKFVLMEVT